MPSFHQWTLIFLYFFDFFDFGLSWNDFGFLQLFLAFFWDFSLAVGMFNFVASYWYTGCVIYAIDWIRWD